MTTKEQVLQNCTVEGTLVKLPNVQLDRKLYQEVAKSLELIGGKWKGGKVFGFIFATDPSELLQQISNGEKRNLKKEFQFFATSPELADELVELTDIKHGDEILEPSAGQGAIVHAILRAGNLSGSIWGYELMEVNQIILNKIPNFKLLGSDFLTECDTSFDKIIANPPFSKNQDIDHIKKMYTCLRKGGRLVSMASESWVKGSQKKQIDFRKWLDEVGAQIINVAKGAFKDSGTMVSSKIIVINK